MNNFFYKRNISILLGQLTLIISIISVIPLPVVSQTEETIVVDRIVAVVNDEIITLFDLNQALQPYAENIRALGYSEEKERKTLFKLRSDLLNQLIDSILTDQEIKKNNIRVSKQQIDNAIERIKEARYLTDEELRAGLSKQGLTMEEYRKGLKQQFLKTRLVNREVKSKIVITDEDIRSYYNNHRENYAGEKKYHLWNIFIRVSPLSAESKKHFALEKMEAVLAKLKQGHPFETLAIRNPGSSSAPKRADLGLYRLNELSPQLQKVVKKMEAGQFTSVLKTDQGYQIVYVQKVLETEAKSLAEVKSEIHEILYNESVDNKYQTWLEDLRNRSHIRIIK